MAALKQFLLELKERVITALKEAWTNEPTAIVTAVVAGVVTIGAAFGVVIPKQTVEVIVPLVIPILLGGLVVRSQVRPTGPSAKAIQLRNRVVSRHRLRRRARAQRARIEGLQRAAGATTHYVDGDALDRLKKLKLKPDDKLQIPSKRIGGWWVVEIVG
jgi:hypothetical protein